MSRSVHSVGTIVGLALLNACGAAPEGASDTPTESVVETQTALNIDCRPYDGLTASLAHATIECTNTIGPKSFTTANGYLQPTFRECSSGNTEAMQTILQLTNLQKPRKLQDSEKIRACFAGQWDEWLKNFSQQSDTTCPVWKVDPTFVSEDTKPVTVDDITYVPGSSTLEVVARYSKTLPPIGPKPVGTQADGTPIFPIQDPGANHVGIGTETFRYNVVFNRLVRTKVTAARRAVDCAGGLPDPLRAIASTDGRAQQVIADPLWWLVPTVYSPGANPFAKASYYHPMSFYGPLPGAMYGNGNRAGEACSYYGGSMHLLTKLQLDCMDFSDTSTCISYCTL